MPCPMHAASFMRTASKPTLFACAVKPPLQEDFMDVKQIVESWRKEWG